MAGVAEVAAVEPAVRKKRGRAEGESPPPADASRETSARETLIVPVRWVGRGVQNPREGFDPEALRELADDIREHGLLQPVVVRPQPEGSWFIEPGRSGGREGFFVLDRRRYYQGEHGEGKYNGEMEEIPFSTTREEAEGRVPRYELIAGERRWRAHLLAGLEEIAVVVIRGIDDRRALELALVENLQRRDLQPLEEAQGYRRLAEMGYGQEEIGQRVNRSRAAVGNAMRLLKLPEDVLQRIAAGQLQPSHGLAILRFDGFPAVMSRIGELAVAQKTPSHDMERGLPFNGELMRAGLVRSLDYNTPFAWKEVCRQCPFGAYRKGDYDGYGHCLRPEHWVELQQQTRAGHDAALRDLKAGKKPQQGEDGKPLINLALMKYGQYEEIYRGDSVPGCTKECPCRAQALDRNDQVVNVCLDPKRRAKFKGAKTREDNKAKRTEDAAKMEAAMEVVAAVVEPPPAALAMLLARALDGIYDEEHFAAAIRLIGREWEAAAFTHYERKRKEAAALLATLPPAEQLRFAVACVARQELERSLGMHGVGTPLLDVLRAGQLPAVTVEVTAAEPESAAAGPEAESAAATESPAPNPYLKPGERVEWSEGGLLLGVTSDAPEKPRRGKAAAPAVFVQDAFAGRKGAEVEGAPPAMAYPAGTALEWDEGGELREGVLKGQDRHLLLIDCPGGRMTPLPVDTASLRVKGAARV